MIKAFYYVLFITLKSLFAATFVLKRNMPLYLSGLNLFKRSFRLSNEEIKNPFIVLKRSLSTLKSILLSSKTHLDLFSSEEFIYDISSNSKKMRQDYIKHFTGTSVDNYIPKLELFGLMNVPERLFVSFTLSVFLPFFFMASLFSSRRPSLSLMCSEISENAILLFLVKKHKLKKCYFFSIYEKDSNIAAYILMKNDVTVIKIPSEVPFYFFNTTILCNKLILCTAYQKDELEAYRNTLIYKETEFWGPERVCDFYDVYKRKEFKIRRNAIAFYSTASWVREKEGHMDQGTNMKKNEQLLLGYLQEYLKLRTDKTLIIYLHPKERSEKYLEEAKQYYKTLLPDVNFNFADFTMLSAGSFYNAETAVAFNSTLVQERLYFGFKILLLPLDHSGFPVNGSSFNNICAYSKDELFLKMDKTFGESEDDFFNRNGLLNYRFR